jgi:hypothetical protein
MDRGTTIGRSLERPLPRSGELRAARGPPSVSRAAGSERLGSTRCASLAPPPIDVREGRSYDRTCLVATGAVVAALLMPAGARAFGPAASGEPRQRTRPASVRGGVQQTGRPRSNCRRRTQGRRAGTAELRSLLPGRGQPSPGAHRERLAAAAFRESPLEQSGRASHRDVRTRPSLGDEVRSGLLLPLGLPSPISLPREVREPQSRQWRNQADLSGRPADLLRRARSLSGQGIARIRRSRAAGLESATPVLEPCDPPPGVQDWMWRRRELLPLPWTRAATRRRTGPPETPDFPRWSGGPCGPTNRAPRRACSIRRGGTPLHRSYV